MPRKKIAKAASERVTEIKKKRRGFFSFFLIQPNSFELADAIFEICKEEVGDAFANPFQISGISTLW
jgi:hypothetical protein